MLQALELYGFKSFADKTRFEFPPGITVIVGPNGSGKSNVVDAIRWVLGEQSAKSLRGKEMADVIFKGTNARKMMGMAEATLFFDNHQRLLAIDADEVRITRRVYRSGEGEYLINGQPCRLKDVRDLFRGTGLGTDAYSIIEQGKVDQLLQASPKERRALFEEAAGISRFRAKRQEAERRLERVEQNLLRLGDLVDEVRQRLETVRSQAEKARQYRQLSEQLSQLRAEVAWCDWQRLVRRFDEAHKRLQEEQQKLGQVVAERESLERQLHDFEQQAAQLDTQWRTCQEQLVTLRDQIAARQSVAELERARLDELHEEVRLHLEHERAAVRRADQLQDRVKHGRMHVEEQHRRWLALQEDCREQDQLLADLSSQWAQLDQQVHALRLEQLNIMRLLGRLGSEESRLGAELAAAEANRAEALRQADEQSRELEQWQERLGRFLAEQEQLSAELHSAQRAVQQAQHELAQARRVHDRRHQEALQWRHSQQAIEQRLKLLEEWQQNDQSIGPGERQLLEYRDRGHSEILGTLADLLQCEPFDAPYVDAALGDAARWVVLTSNEALEHWSSQAGDLKGPVHLVSLQNVPQRIDRRPARWEGRPGVLRRLDRMVECPHNVRLLVEYLLGRTYLVESLAIAWQCHRSTPGRARFVTLDGAVLERDGRLVVGPRPSDQQPITRRTEIQALRSELARVERLASEAELEVRRWAEHVEQLEVQMRRLVEEERTAHEALVQKRAMIQAASHEQAACRNRLEQAERKKQQSLQLIDVLGAKLRSVSRQREEGEQQLRQTEEQLTKALDERDRADRRRQQQVELRAQRQIELSAARQRLEALQSQLQQLEETCAEVHRVLDEARGNLERVTERRRLSERVILTATSELAQFYWDKQQLEQLLDTTVRARSDLEIHRQRLQRTIQQLLRRQQQLQETAHRLELDVEQLRQARSLLEARVRDELGIEITDWQGTAASEQSTEQRAAMANQIENLRQQIQQFGAVNLQAVEELESLESRYNHLAAQYDDLRHAKQSLERLIQRTNSDCRRLFLETLEAVRANFQSIYRKAFGGGRADLALEPNVDVLEAGVDIVATPPGKPTFSNSLLSGGERALTAVALLLAIFQYRPSPFCILDEVDAPFDEANIERFIDVLHDFLAWTKFVIVTHSKKTMTAANTLHGVTMQESGVSKRVSVRFDDVSEDGQIASTALVREAG